MDLILWRHAEAESGAPDDGRRLTAKGQRQADKMAAWLKARLPEPTRILVSPARRARQTAAALTDRFEVIAALGAGATASAVLRAAGWPDAEGAVVVVGHQPVLGEVAALLLANVQQSWSIKKGGVWWFGNRARGEEPQTVLRLVISPEFL
jgi:phosphohistidine phosphatase